MANKPLAVMSLSIYLMITCASAATAEVSVQSLLFTGDSSLLVTAEYKLERALISLDIKSGAKRSHVVAPAEAKIGYLFGSLDCLMGWHISGWPRYGAISSFYNDEFYNRAVSAERAFETSSQGTQSQLTVLGVLSCEHILGTTTVDSKLTYKILNTRTKEVVIVPTNFAAIVRPNEFSHLFGASRSVFLTCERTPADHNKKDYVRAVDILTGESKHICDVDAPRLKFIAQHDHDCLIAITSYEDHTDFFKFDAHADAVQPETKLWSVPTPAFECSTTGQIAYPEGPHGLFYKTLSEEKVLRFKVPKYQSFALSPVGSVLAMTDGKTVSLLDIATGKLSTIEFDEIPRLEPSEVITADDLSTPKPWLLKKIEALFSPY
jgi:hypothetical protein